MGEIRRRGRTSYQIRFYRNGRRLEETIKATSLREAERQLRIREGKIAAGAPLTAAMLRTTVEAALDDVIADYTVNAKRSLDDVQRRVTKHLRPWFAGWKLSDVGPDAARAYTLHRQGEDAKPATINRELGVLKRAITLAAQAGKLLTRPYIPMLREDSVRRGFLEPGQLDAVCRRLAPELAAVVRFASITGWRVPSEVLPLTWSRVDLKAGTVVLDPGTTKNGRGRTFPMTDELRALLTARRATTDADQKATGSIIPWVFYRMTAKGRGGPKAARPITSFAKAWKTATEAAGCPGRIPHDLRRTAVRSFVRAGISQTVAMALSGHETDSVFRRYAIVASGDLTDAAAKLNAAAGTTQGQLGAGQPTGAERSA